jgi:hypothetical protein
MNRVSAPRASSMDCLPVLVQNHSTTASKFRPSEPSSASTHLLDHDFGVRFYIRSIMASKCVSIYARLGPPSASRNSLDHGLQVYLQTRSITTSKWICNLAQLQSLNSLNHGLLVYLQSCSITASMCIYALAQSQSRSASPSSLDCTLQVYL